MSDISFSSQNPVYPQGQNFGNLESFCEGSNGILYAKYDQLTIKTYYRDFTEPQIIQIPSKRGVDRVNEIDLRSEQLHQERSTSISLPETQLSQLNPSLSPGILSLVSNSTSTSIVGSNDSSFIYPEWDITPGVDASLIKNQQQGKQLVGTVTAFASIVSVTADLSQTFFLNSLPGANQTIYLDFDGNITSDTQWNLDLSRSSIVTPAFNLDGNSASFSNTELQTIQYIWSRVAEDFSPFNVNVTTQPPADINDLIRSSNNDSRWGVRVAIGGSSADWLGVSAGGIAYVDSFNWNSDTPVFVFPAQLGGGNEKYTADAITHEVGHSLGLSHNGVINPFQEYYQGNGSGETGWAPIMGVGYYQNLVQWSKGEYAGANNGEDDLQIITSQNGFGYRLDDTGNTIATAKPLTIAGTSLSGSGIIERNTDVDFYSFNTSGGSISLMINPFSRGPNLDILAELYNSSGTLVTSSNPSDLLSATIATTVTAGTYYLKIDGVGKGNPLTTGYTDYGSLGQYFISGTIPNNLPTITLTLSPTSVAEDGLTNLVYTFTRTGDLTTPLTVNYTIGGTAVSNTDYTPIGATSFNGTTGTITFLANASTAILTLDPKTDTIVEPDKTIILTLASGTGYSLNTLTSLTGTILDDDYNLVRTVGTIALGKNNLGYAISTDSGNTFTKPLTFNSQPVSDSNPGGGWKPIAATLSASNGNFDLFWKNPLTGESAYWLVNNNGVYTSGGVISNADLLNWETTDQLDLNGDNKIGVVYTLVRTVGTIALGSSDLGYAISTDSGNTFTKLLTLNSQAVSDSNPGGGWKPIAATLSASNGNFDLFWKNTLTGQYYHWLVNNNGGYTSGEALSTANLLTWETTDKLDLNGDGRYRVGQIDYLTGLPSVNNSSLKTYNLTYSGGPLSTVTGSSDYGVLQNWQNGDQIILNQSLTDYVLGNITNLNGVSGTGIYKDLNHNSLIDTSDRLVGLVKNVTGLALNDPTKFQFV